MYFISLDHQRMVFKTIWIKYKPPFNLLFPHYSRNLPYTLNNWVPAQKEQSLSIFISMCQYLHYQALKLSIFSSQLNGSSFELMLWSQAAKESLFFCCIWTNWVALYCQSWIIFWPTNVMSWQLGFGSSDFFLKLLRNRFIYALNLN